MQNDGLSFTVMAGLARFARIIYLPAKQDPAIRVFDAAAK